jgi:hypothetical protein
MPVVFVVSGEWDLRGGVRAELRERGITALGMETIDDMGRTIGGGIAPSAAVLDGALLHDAESLAAVQNLSSHIPVLVIDSRVNPAPPLAGAKKMLRPVQVKQIVSRVMEMISFPRS